MRNHVFNVEKFKLPSFQELSGKDLAVVLIVMLAPTFGSLVTFLGCTVGFYFLLQALFFQKLKAITNFKVIGWLYLTYCFYFLANGFLNSGVYVTLISMAPNLPLLLYAFVALVGDWTDTVIDSKKVGIFCTFGVLISTLVASILFFFPITFEFDGRTLTEHSGVNGRLSLLAGNPLPFSSMLVCLSFLGLVGYSRKLKVEALLSWLAIIFTGLIIFFWSESRGSQLTYIALLIVSILSLSRSKRISLGTSRLIYIFLSIVLLSGVIFTISNVKYNEGQDKYFGKIERIYDGYKQLFVTSSSFHVRDHIDFSVSSRKLLLATGMETFLSRPVFGYGHDRMYSEVQGRNEFFSDKGYTHLHNSYLNHLVSGGLLGFFSFISILFLPLWLTRNMSKYSESRFFALIIFYYSLMSGLTNLYFNHDLLTSFHGILPLLLAASLIGDQKVANEEP